ncbi:MAG: hypothetical protein MUF64_16580 [Polyangiaceae bacterium]|jgi:hypothetical protein|nr:hypothetical protein [Polyangiaceae bacterium]
MPPQPFGILHAYDEALLGRLLTLRERARDALEARVALRAMVADMPVRETSWRAGARRQVELLVSVNAPAVLVEPLRVCATPRAAALAVLDAGALPTDAHIVSLTEVSRLAFPEDPVGLALAIDPSRRRVGGTRSPVVDNFALPDFETGPFSPNTFHLSSDAGDVAAFFASVPSHPAPTLDKVLPLVTKGESTHISWAYASFVAGVAAAARQLARFYSRCANTGLATWVEVEELTPDDDVSR